MGRSRLKRGKAKAAPAPVAMQISTASETTSTVYPPIPDITNLDMAFGNISHMPRYETIPDQFKCSGGTHARFISKWFFSGLKDDDLARLSPRDGVNARKALAAIGAIMRSFEPKHEHKEAGCAFLLNAWFEVTP